MNRKKSRNSIGATAWNGRYAAFALATLVALFSYGCKKDTGKDDIDANVPQCLKQVIQARESRCSVSVYKYVFNEEDAYLIESRCPDALHTLYDTECKHICSPSGGVSGNGDGRCPDFYETAVQVELVYTSP